MQLLNQFGQPLVGEDKLRERFNPTRQMEPSVLERQLTDFRGGDLSKLAKTMDWVEEHDDLAPALADKAKSAVTRHGYEIIKKQNVAAEQEDLADAQQKALQGFYERLVVKDITDEDECGGVRLLMKQMMKAFSMRYQAHHLIWTPSANGLQLEAKAVPLWFFENSKGRMRFVGDKGGTSGEELETKGGESAWMVSKGRGVMLAGVIVWMFKKMPLQDWITYSGRHGMPGYLGKSSADPGSQEWQNMASAVYTMAAEFAAVVSNSDEIEVLDLKGNGQVPYPALVERMDKMLTILYRGADLSTMSSGDSVGASVQSAETEALDEDNAVWLSETINANITQRFIEYTFGEDAPVLVELSVKTKQSQLNVAEIGTLVENGLKIPTSYIHSEFQIPQAEDGEEVLGKVGSSQLPVASPNSRGINLTEKFNALNTTQDEEASLLKNSLAEAVGVLPEVFDDLDAFFEQLEAVDAEQDPVAYLDAIEALVDELPEFFDPENADLLVEVLEKALGAGALQGVRDEIVSLALR